jgi:outer membrane biogenesis lipoprotein LolB
MKTLLQVTFLSVALALISGCSTPSNVRTNNPNEPKVIKVVWHKVDNPWQHCGHAAQACSLLKGDTLYVWTRLPRPGDDVELQADLGHEVWHGFEPHFHPHRMTRGKQ